MRKLLAATIVLALLLSMPFGSVKADEILDLKLKILELQNKGDLGFRTMLLCRKVMNYGTYIPLEDNTMGKGGSLTVYYEPSHWFTNVNQGRYELWLNQDLILLNAEGEEIFKQEKVLEMHFNTSQPVLDVFMTNNFNVGEIPPGKYTYIVVLRDQLKDQSAEARADFIIEDKPAEPKQ